MNSINVLTYDNLDLIAFEEGEPYPIEAGRNCQYLSLKAFWRNLNLLPFEDDELAAIEAGRDYHKISEMAFWRHQLRDPRRASLVFFIVAQRGLFREPASLWSKIMLHSYGLYPQTFYVDGSFYSSPSSVANRKAVLYRYNNRTICTATSLLSEGADAAYKYCLGK